MTHEFPLGSWQYIGENNISAVVCQHYNDPNYVMVVYLQNKEAIARDAIYSNGKWKFEYPEPDGWKADNRPGLHEYILILKRGRHPR